MSESSSAPRCNGRYLVPQKREEPFDVTYRCGLPLGHAGSHGSGADPVSPIPADPPVPSDPWADLERLQDQARAISALLTDAGCNAMPIEAGVRWLRDRAETADAEIARLRAAFAQHCLSCPQCRDALRPLLP